jgi:type IV pilus assembly protein PilM
LDIGHKTLKVVQVSGRGKAIRLHGAVEIDVPSGSIGRNGVVHPEFLRDKIHEAMAGALPKKITAASCVTALPESLVFTKTVDLPKLPERELEKAVPFELANVFPVTPDEAYFDWEFLGPSKDPTKIEGLVVAAPKTLVDSMVDLLKSANLDPVALETKPVALARLFANRSEKGMLIIDIGAISSSISLLDRKTLHLTSTASVGGDHLKSTTSRVETLAEEALRLIKFYQNRIEVATEFNLAILTGGGANIKGVEASLQKFLKFEVTVGRPFVNWPSYDPKFATALGLSMREIK